MLIKPLFLKTACNRKESIWIYRDLLIPFFLRLASYQYKKQLTAAMEISVLPPAIKNTWK